MLIFAACGFFDVNTADTSEILRLDERDSFSEGLTVYYMHIGDLFSHVKAASCVAEFMSLALQTHFQQAVGPDQNVG